MNRPMDRYTPQPRHQTGFSETFARLFIGLVAACFSSTVLAVVGPPLNIFHWVDSEAPPVAGMPQSPPAPSERAAAEQKTSPDEKRVAEAPAEERQPTSTRQGLTGQASLVSSLLAEEERLEKELVNAKKRRRAAAQAVAKAKAKRRELLATQNARRARRAQQRKAEFAARGPAVFTLSNTNVSAPPSGPGRIRASARVENRGGKSGYATVVLKSYYSHQSPRCGRPGSDSTDCFERNYESEKDRARIYLKPGESEWVELEFVRRGDANSTYRIELKN